MKVASVYVGAILGAGFASGKEITEYFLSYGQKGLYGLVLAGVLFGVIGWAVMDITYEHNIKGYKEFADVALGKTFGGIMEWISVIFMFILFSTMLAAGGAIAEQSNIFLSSSKFTTFLSSSELGIILLALVCGITFMFDMRGIVIVNSIISPLLFCGCIYLGLYAFFEKAIPVSTNLLKIKDNWIFSAMVYVAYNVITAISVLTSMGELLDNKKTAKYGGLIGGLTLGIMGVCLGLGLLVNYEQVAPLQLPMLQIASKYGITIEGFYIFMLILAMYTTAVINGYSAIAWAVKKFKINKSIFTLLFITAGIIAGQLQFSEFIRVIYPLFGYIGMFEIIVILTNFLFTKD